ncbi:MAG: TRAP transporter large permease subunit [Deltaproteobacteria bacterium]
MESKEKKGISGPSISRIMTWWDGTEKWISGSLMAFALMLSFYSVVARYVLHLPLDWSDEISAYAVIWCTFFGISALIKTDQHVRVDLLTGRFSEKRQNILNLFHTLLGLGFVLVVAWGGYLMVKKAHANFITSESHLKYPMYLPFLIMPLGGLLLSFRMVERLVRVGQRLKGQRVFRDPMLFGILFVSACLVYILTLRIDITMALILLLMVMLFAGMPIAFGMGISSLVCLLFFGMIKIDGIAPKMFWSVNKFILIAIPFFIVSGNLMMKGGLARPLLELGYALLKRIDGGLAIAVMFAAVIFSAISGVSAALAATLGIIAIPWMMEKGYPKRFCMGLIGAGGTLDILIPPSTVLILYGAVSGESISDLYIAGFLPGFILGLALSVEVWLICKSKGYGRPAAEDRFSWKEVADKTKKSFWALLMPIIIMGGIYSGIFTVTEASVVAVFYAVFVCFAVYRNIGIKELVLILNDSVVLTSIIYFILMAATLFGFLVTMEQLSDRLLATMVSVDIKPWMFLGIMNLAIFIMGMFLTPGSIILIVLPIVYPILQQLNISGVHFGILMTINMELAFLTPPVGMHLFVMSAVCKESVTEVIKGVFPFLILLFVGLFVITYFPSVSLVFLGGK